MYRDDPWVVISDSQDRPTRILLDLWRHTYVISHVLDYARHFLPFSLFLLCFDFIFCFLCLSDSNFYFLSVLIISLISIICSHFLCFLFALILYCLFSPFPHSLFSLSSFYYLYYPFSPLSVSLTHSSQQQVFPCLLFVLKQPYFLTQIAVIIQQTSRLTTYQTNQYGTPSHAMVRKSSLP